MTESFCHIDGDGDVLFRTWTVKYTKSLAESGVQADSSGSPQMAHTLAGTHIHTDRHTRTHKHTYTHTHTHTHTQITIKALSTSSPIAPAVMRN